MSRRRAAEKREVLPDAKFGDTVLAKFINSVMEQGKKGVAERIVYGALDRISKKASQDAVKVFHDAIENVKPTVEVRSRRVGGATYQVPVQIEGRRRQSLAIRWILTSARGRSGRSMTEKLANEILDASNGQGATIKRREDTHRMAEANRAFAHYRY